MSKVDIYDVRKQVKHFIRAGKAFDDYPQTVILENSLVRYIETHFEPKRTLSQRLMRALRHIGRSQNASGDPKRKANT